MIVTDTNIICYLLVPGDRTQEAERVYERDQVWVAPLLWQSEFRSTLAVYMRRRLLALEDAVRTMSRAELLFEGRAHDVPSAQVLTLAATSGCSAYDCEFIALAQDLRVPLITSDSELLSKFKGTAMSMKAFNA